MHDENFSNFALISRILLVTSNSNNNNSNSNRLDEFPVPKREFTDPLCFIALLLTWCIDIGLSMHTCCKEWW